jgi:hypothetical protein
MFSCNAVGPHAPACGTAAVSALGSHHPRIFGSRLPRLGPCLCRTAGPPICASVGGGVVRPARADSRWPACPFWSLLGSRLSRAARALYISLPLPLAPLCLFDMHVMAVDGGGHFSAWAVEVLMPPAPGQSTSHPLAGLLVVGSRTSMRTQ